jgi:hypothetical protein
MSWKLNLNEDPPTIFEAQQMAAMAQRVMNDAVFVDFLVKMQDAASNTALFDDKLETRDAARVKVLTIAELKARLEDAAKRAVQDTEDQEQATIFE